MDLGDRQKLAASALALLLLFASAGARAEEEPEAQQSSGDVEATFTVVSDNRFRGTSLSDGDPAWQVYISAALTRNLTVAAQANRVRFEPAGNVELGATLEWQVGASALSPTISAAFYHYPGAKEFDYLELGAEIPVISGPTEAILEIRHAPPIHGNGSFSSTYLGLAASRRLHSLPITVNASAGIEDRRGYRTKFDWLIGVSVDLGQGWEIDASYVDSRGSGLDEIADAKLVASITRSF